MIMEILQRQVKTSLKLSLSFWHFKTKHEFCGQNVKPKGKEGSFLGRTYTNLVQLFLLLCRDCPDRWLIPVPGTFEAKARS